MRNHILPASILTLLLLLLCSGVYTTGVWLVARLAPEQGNGWVIRHGEKTWFTHVGQAFDSDRYFWSRPSAVGYNAAGSAGSNKGPLNPDYLAQVQARIDTFAAHHPGVNRADIPADLVTASGSGLDPHISPQAARVQAGRIAAVRNFPEDQVRALVEKHVEKPVLGLFGPERVHVLTLNLALDDLSATH